MIRKVALLVVIVMASLTANAQDYKFGIRAGLNGSTFRGETLNLENAQENFGFSTGFHFGITWDYQFTDIIGFKTELLYIQNGASYSYDGDGYYKIYLEDDITRVERGLVDQDLDISNAYITIPAMISAQLGKRWEVYGGAYASLLVQPTGRGTFDFTSFDNAEGIRFTQSLDYNYRSDIPGGFNTSISPIVLIVDGETTSIAKVAGGYYQFTEDEKTNKAINRFDVGLIGGFNYFINKGFYIGLRGQLGFLDITDNSVDRVLNDLNPDDSIIVSDDRDLHLGIQASFGFKF
jgi:hypothetical protein